MMNKLSTIETASPVADVAAEQPSLVSLAYRAIVAVTILGGLWFIWSNRFLPLQDYPDWLYQGFLFSRFLIGHAPAQYSIRPYPVPDTALTVIIGLLSVVTAPEVAGKIVLSLFLGSFVLSSIYLLKAFNRCERNPLLYLPLILAFNCWFFHGNVAYYFGLSVFFLFCGYVVRRLGNLEAINGIAVYVVFTILFFTHLMSYLAAGIFITVVFLTRLGKVAFRKLVLPAGLSGILLPWYAFARLGSGELHGALWQQWSNLHGLAGNLIYPFVPFWSFRPFLTPHSAVMQLAGMLNGLWILTIAALAIGSVWLALFDDDRPDARPVIVTSAVLFLCFFAAGDSFALGSTGDRFLYPSLWLACCWLGSQSGFARWSVPGRAAKVVGVTLIAVQCLWLNFCVGAVSGRLAGVFQEMRTAQAKSPAQFCRVYGQYFQQSEGRHPLPLEQVLVPNIRSPIRVPYYFYINENVSVPIFPVGMLRFGGRGNFNNLCG
jgi:hypothetical protein